MLMLLVALPPPSQPPASRLALTSERAFGPRLSQLHVCGKLLFRPLVLGGEGSACCLCGCVSVPLLPLRSAQEKSPLCSDRNVCTEE